MTSDTTETPIRTLFERREALGLTTRQMTALLGIRCLSNYTRIENGRRELTLQQRRSLETVEFIAEERLLSRLLRSFGL